MTVTGVDNDIDAPDKTVKIKGAASSTLGVSGPADVELTIEDDDEATEPRNSIVTIAEDSTYIFAASDFGFSARDKQDSQVAVEIVATPADGVLMLGETMVGASDVISKADMDEGDFRFIPAENAHGEPYTSFTFRASDDNEGNTAIHTITINVTSVNDPATSKPELSGESAFRKVLSAETSSIEDVDGLTRVEFSYRWIRIENGEDTEIENATERTYTVQEIDIGKRLKVRVDFTDDGGFAETLISDATGAVAPATPLEPQNLRATGGNEQVVLTWEPPSENGGEEILAYHYRYALGDSVAEGIGPGIRRSSI